MKKNILFIQFLLIVSNYSFSQKRTLEKVTDMTPLVKLNSNIAEIRTYNLYNISQNNLSSEDLNASFNSRNDKILIRFKIIDNRKVINSLNEEEKNRIIIFSKEFQILFIFKENSILKFSETLKEFIESEMQF